MTYKVFELIINSFYVSIYISILSIEKKIELTYYSCKKHT